MRASLLLAALLIAGRAFAAPADLDALDDEAPPTPSPLELAPPSVRAEVLKVRDGLRVAKIGLLAFAAANGVIATALGGGLLGGSPGGDCEILCTGQSIGFLTAAIAGQLSLCGFLAVIAVDVVAARWPEARRFAVSGSGLAVRF
jgi:hypothetical protein